MAILVGRLERAGYRVVSVAYPSMSESLETLVEHLGSEVLRCCSSHADRVHFVTHSMGGLLVRGYLAQQPRPHAGRVVMLSPPSKGSEFVDALAETPFLAAILGPAGAQLGTDSTAYPNRLPPIRFSLGIITGNRSSNPIGSWLIPGPDDGKVGVEGAKVEGATDFLVIPASHTFIMNRGDVADEVVRFLRHGQFGAAS